jgi:hypothetical protein
MFTVTLLIVSSVALGAPVLHNAIVVTALVRPVTPPAIDPPVVELVNTFTGVVITDESINAIVPSGVS